MLIGIRKLLNAESSIIYNEDNLMVLKLRDNQSQYIIGNIYRCFPQPQRRALMDKLENMLHKVEGKKVILAGDWNELPNEMLKIFGKKGINMWANNAPTKGTRITKKRKRSSKTIDFGIANRDNLILKQAVKTRYNLSDHLPVIITINSNKTIRENEEMLIFDRKLLHNKMVAQKIVNHNYVTHYEDSNISATIKELDYILRQTNVLRLEKRKQEKLFLPTKKRKSD